MFLAETITEGSSTIYRTVQYNWLEALFMRRQVEGARFWFFENHQTIKERV